MKKCYLILLRTINEEDKSVSWNPIGVYDTEDEALENMVDLVTNDRVTIRPYKYDRSGCYVEGLSLDFDDLKLIEMSMNRLALFGNYQLDVSDHVDPMLKTI